MGAVCRASFGDLRIGGNADVSICTDKRCRKSSLSGADETTYDSDVRHVRRPVAIALQCALLTMWSVGSGFACELGTDHATHMAMDAMPMSDMPGMPAHEPGNSAPEGLTDSHSDCEFPWSSGDCQAMTSCTPNAVAADEPSFVSIAQGAHDEPTSRADQPRSVVRSPEPPPPRA